MNLTLLLVASLAAPASCSPQLAPPGTGSSPRANPLDLETDGYDFEAPTRFDKLFTGTAAGPPSVTQAH